MQKNNRWDSLDARFDRAYNNEHARLFDLATNTARSQGLILFVLEDVAINAVQEHYTAMKMKWFVQGSPTPISPFIRENDGLLVTITRSRVVDAQRKYLVPAKKQKSPVPLFQDHNSDPNSPRTVKPSSEPGKRRTVSYNETSGNGSEFLDIIPDNTGHYEDVENRLQWQYIQALLKRKLSPHYFTIVSKWMPLVTDGYNLAEAAKVLEISQFTLKRAKIQCQKVAAQLQLF